MPKESVAFRIPGQTSHRAPFAAQRMSIHLTSAATIATLRPKSLLPFHKRFKRAFYFGRDLAVGTSFTFICRGYPHEWATRRRPLPALSELTGSLLLFTVSHTRSAFSVKYHRHPFHNLLQIYASDVACDDDAVGHLFPPLLLFSRSCSFDFFVGLPDWNSVWGISFRHDAGCRSCHTSRVAFRQLSLG